MNEKVKSLEINLEISVRQIEVDRLEKKIQLERAIWQQNKLGKIRSDIRNRMIMIQKDLIEIEST